VLIVVDMVLKPTLYGCATAAEGQMPVSAPESRLPPSMLLTLDEPLVSVITKMKVL
jgi:hypothetical protein